MVLFFLCPEMPVTQSFPKRRCTFHGFPFPDMPFTGAIDTRSSMECLSKVLNLWWTNMDYNGKSHRVLMFKIPAAVAGMPTEWNTRYYARNGESLVPLQQYKIDTIRNQDRRDWSKLIISGATIEHLDKEAIAFAREKYKEKMNRPHITEEVNSMSDEEFLRQYRTEK